MDSANGSTRKTAPPKPRRLPFVVPTSGGKGLLERARVIVGVMPPRSAKALTFMKEEVPGVIIPDAVIRRFASAKDPKAEGAAFAKEAIETARANPSIAGVHFMPVGWEEAVPELSAYCRGKSG